MRDLQPGDVIVIHYPDTTDVRYPMRHTAGPREIVIRSIRDMVQQPLTIQEFLRRPWVHRSRWLVRAWEPERGQYRQFYLGCTAEFAGPTQLRVAYFDPVLWRPTRVLYRGINPTVADRRLLARTLQKWVGKEVEEMPIRIYADDMRLVS